MNEAAFLQRILEDPAGAGMTWLVLADWLEERGDRRHELIRFQHDPRYRPDLAAAERDEQVCVLLRAGLKPPLPTVTNSLGMRFVYVPPGTFLMGSPEMEKGRTPAEGPQHEVEITRPFLMGVYPVTQGEYERVTGSNPSHQGKLWTDAKRFPVRFPVENVSWGDAVEFCEKLAEIPEERLSGGRYRLPTEAEWEYACRGGRLFQHVSAPFYFIEPAFAIDSTLANISGDYPPGSDKKGSALKRPTQVGSDPPNPLGLHDMHGNVWEWCHDWYDASYYRRSERQNPQGPANGTDRALRGGSWYTFLSCYCRTGFRWNLSPGARRFDLGFRLVLDLAPGLVCS